MINLFEYQNRVPYNGKTSDLEAFLDEIWSKREKHGYYYQQDEEEARVEEQRFIQFLHKSNELKSNKYVGVIFFEGRKINLLPKIFFDPAREYDVADVNAMQNHILWWLSYCSKIKFPNYQTSLGSMKNDFFEVLIYLFSKYTRQLLSSSIYQQYEEVRRELSFIKGRLNTNAYITDNLSKGRWHKMNCIYDSFEMDNKFNRIIKFVVTQLFNLSHNEENKSNLREILFILDEVSDEPATAADCANLKFNPMFGEFETVRDYCYLFLSNSISFSYKNELKLFAFLLPMEYVFEDFVFGFIDRELDEVKAKKQLSSKHLDTAKNFALRPDLMLRIGNKSVIADTKYKIIYSNSSDPKKGISQNDLYQMLAYAVRYKINDIILFYPDTISSEALHEGEVVIEDELAGGEEVRVRAYQLPVINHELFKANLQNMELSHLFMNCRNDLAARLIEIFSLKGVNKIQIS